MVVQWCNRCRQLILPALVVVMTAGCHLFGRRTDQGGGLVGRGNRQTNTSNDAELFYVVAFVAVMFGLIMLMVIAVQAYYTWQRFKLHKASCRDGDPPHSQGQGDAAGNNQHVDR